MSKAGYSEDKSTSSFYKSTEFQGIKEQSSSQFKEISNEITKIVSTQSVTLALTSAGQVYSWGSISLSLGRRLAKREDSRVPMLITELRDINIIDICSGRDHVLALDQDKFVWAWGSNCNGQLGIDSTEDQNLPQRIDQVTNVDKIWAGQDSSFALTKLNFYAWGSNRGGILIPYSKENQKLNDVLKMPTQFVNTPWKQAQVGANVMNVIARPGESNKILAKRFSEDDTIQRLENLKNEAEEARRRINDMKENEKSKLKQVDFDVSNYQLQEKDLLVRDKEIWQQIEEIENQIKKCQRENQDFQQLEIEKKNKRELAAANESIKSQMYKKQTDKENERLHLQMKFNKLKEQSKDYKTKIDMFEKLIRVQKESLAREYFQFHSSDIQSDIQQIFYYFNNLQFTKAHQLSKNVQCSGMQDLLKLSNKFLRQIQNEAHKHKLSKDSVAYETFSKIWAMFDDNVELRLYINDLLEGIMQQTSKRLEEIYQQTQDLIYKKEDVVNKEEKHEAEEFLKKKINQIKNKEDID